MAGKKNKVKDDQSFRDLVTYRINSLANTIFRSATPTYVDITELRAPEAWVLTTIGDFGPMSASQVSEFMSIDKAQVSRALNRLIEQELVARLDDPEDQRRSLLTLTKKGRVLSNKVVRIGRDRQEKILARFNAGERKLLVEFLERLQANADELLDAKNNGK
jgi:DNA-binding MarR family transcriptional regulator